MKSAGEYSEQLTWRGVSGGMSYSPATATGAASLSATWVLQGVQDPADLTVADDVVLALESLIGHQLEIESFPGIQCSHCHRQSKKSYGQGYCYPCFKKLARCDLCMMAPTRCHFDAGTCREPQWAQDFCFSDHIVYLALSSGLKVGLTRFGQEFRRWSNQGAVAGLALLQTDSRQLAGTLEAQLSQQVSDRSQWRALVSSVPDPVDLVAKAAELLQQREIDFGPLPPGVQSIVTAPQYLTYPGIGFAPPTQIKLQPGAVSRLQLLGLRGQYLLCEEGALNVGSLKGIEIQLTDLGETKPEDPDSQLELFN